MSWSPRSTRRSAFSKPTRVATVADSSPLILYAKIGRLDLLHALFGSILVPPSVEREVSAPGKPGSFELTAADWIAVVPLRATPTELGVPEHLGPGEAEAIALALEMTGGVVLLLDERSGRRAAERLGVSVIGSAGVALLAKRRGVVPAVRPLLDALRAAGMFLDERTYRQVLAHATQ